MAQYVKQLDNLRDGVTLYSFTHLVAQGNHRDKKAIERKPIQDWNESPWLLTDSPLDFRLETDQEVCQYTETTGFLVSRMNSGIRRDDKKLACASWACGGLWSKQCGQEAGNLVGCYGWGPGAGDQNQRLEAESRGGMINAFSENHVSQISS